MVHWLVIPAAVGLDLILGDPRWLPHPIRWMGSAIEKFETDFYTLKLPLVLNGGLFWITLVGATFGVVAAIVAIAGAIHFQLKIILEILIIYYALSARSLSKEAMGVFYALKNDDLPLARNRVAMIVGRDTRNLSPSQVAQAAVETVAENLVDGFAAPLFFAAVGGAPLAMAYKMVNTLDSMVGYKNDQYYLFGRVSARMDDLFNYLPARLSIPIIALCTGLFSRNKVTRSWNTAKRDGRKHTSPNAGFAEAAFAGALQVRLGGPSIYHGNVVHKPHIGKEFGPVETHHIQRACRLMLVSAVAWGLCMWFLSMLI